MPLRTARSNPVLADRSVGFGVLILQAAAGATDGVADLALSHVSRKDAFEDLGATASEAWRGLGVAGNPKAVTVTVRAVALPRIIHSVRRHLAASLSARVPGVRVDGRPNAKLVMKLDIEGLEFSVLPAMVRMQALCALDAIRIEWHTRFWSANVAKASAATRNLTASERGAAAMVVVTDAICKSIRHALSPHMESWAAERCHTASSRASKRPQVVRHELGRTTARDCKTELIDTDDETYVHDRKPWPATRICPDARRL